MKLKKEYMSGGVEMRKLIDMVNALGTYSKWYTFTEEEVNNHIDDNRSGNYQYGYLDANNQYVVRYVGSSDVDLKTRIKHGLQEKNSKLKYDYFRFSYADSTKDAYERECYDYHSNGGADGKLDNDIHPAALDSNLSCPVCGNRTLPILRRKANI